ncbi:helix-turn-helix transcriptional regulator [Streptomyces sp. P1-3]|uniref:helix-turn-helix transcriptional regulator n=1 Tax=Streptomyces sp. P1-3 TaxID=3421658 RepID=UPI003D365A3A
MAGLGALPAEPGAAAASDYVERALLAARDLIESTVSRHRRELAQSALVGAVPSDAVDRLVRGATQSVSAVLVGGEQEDALFSALGRHTRTGRHTGTGGDRVAVKLLCVPGAAPATRARALASGAPACEIRVADSDLQEALLIDGRTAYVRLGAQRADRHASLVEDAATVQAMELLFAGAWGNAVALEEYPQLGGRLSAETARRVVECLRTGHTDEVAAREMRVSLRTYRRYVAELMRELGAHSRFQAGVRAVELGLLPGRH